MGGVNLASIDESARNVMLSEVSTFTNVNLASPTEASDFKSAIDFGDNIGITNDSGGGECCGNGSSSAYHATGPHFDAAGTNADATKNKARHFDGANFLMADGHVKWFRGTLVSYLAANASKTAVSYFR